MKIPNQCPLCNSAVKSYNNGIGGRCVLNRCQTTYYYVIFTYTNLLNSKSLPMWTEQWDFNGVTIERGCKSDIYTNIRVRNRTILKSDLYLSVSEIHEWIEKYLLF